MHRTQQIEDQIINLREKLTNHDLYYHLSEIEDVKIFMEKHVYAVWDFMSLLKALQNHLTCVTIPWKPSKNGRTARFINEIVIGEESDFDENGLPKSHFEIYIEAMAEVNASPKKINDLVHSIDSLEDVFEKLSTFKFTKAEKEFLEFTFEVIKTNEAHKIAAAFTFGREDLIPDMFMEIISKSSNGDKNTFPKLTYYLNRHIEIDGDEHGPLSLEMITELCGEDDNKWREVLDVSIESLNKRILLWDEIVTEIKKKKSRILQEQRALI